ncbi:class I SAM-dependent methyltransferase [Cellulomonas wangsupingiae]|uniref:Class I SAM-dependent methyltransferase n=1 Tax=Cellulomonas wangsupingiae TaxID=2968085 RepID=A0ABY5K137_9CELL|nr:class I SAM-dependent methyltransferase [Cellulomonas wangsupingiae]MCC2335917.1 class I SAM-dependent methyltransferase [Cellulomonas wangsupingiae]MCM0639794.1 class I SAM-dependent methyltransferase [Cellulomonas wangsupingiae]UUI64142.1 class I SAM-dependent methyltransferase [Cellulomonas wangsupingiae]
MDDAGLVKLLRPDGWALLQALPPYDERLALPIAERLQKEGLDPSLVAAALTQSRLRAKARGKLGDFADGMLFTVAGLEQATRLEVAAHHARRYLDAGCTYVADLTCGLGADALALAGVGLRVLATDVDETTAALATVNLRAFPEVEIRMGDGLALDLVAEGVDGVYADPARRTGTGRRVFDPRAYSPPLDEVLAVRDTVPALGLKLGPGLAHRDLPVDADAQWVSADGEVVELGLWFGPLAPDGPGRSALVLRDGAAHTLRAHPDGVDDAPPVGPVGGYLYEPDGAVIRAGLVGTVAHRVRGRLVDPTIAYVTSDALADRTAWYPYATAYRVLDELPFGLKRLRTYLRERGVGRLTIKKRGTAVVPETLRRQLDLRGGAEGTVVLTRVAGQQRVLVVEPI